jgi:hypothetical protein
MSWVGCKLVQRLGDDAKQDRIEGRLVLEGDCSNLLRHVDNNVEIANLQKIGPPCGEPVTARFPLVLLTVPVATATIGDIDLVAVLALLDMPRLAERSCTHRPRS